MKYRNKFAFFISVLILITSFSYMVTAESSLSDIEGSWAHYQIQKLVDNKIISGYTDNSFRPNNPISREEFCTIVAKAMLFDGLIADFDAPVGLFNDVGVARWSAKYVETVANYQLVNGKSAGLFDPQANITRQEMAKIVSILYCIKHNLNVNNESSKIDISQYSLVDLQSAGEWANPFIKVALKYGLMNGKPGGIFDPNGLVTRAETATVIFRVLGFTLPIPTATPSPTPVILLDKDPASRILLDFDSIKRGAGRSQFNTFDNGGTELKDNIWTLGLVSMTYYIPAGVSPSKSPYINIFMDKGNAGSWIKYKFYGTGVRLASLKNEDGGKADISILDANGNEVSGTKQTDVDFSATKPNTEIIYENKTLLEGEYTLYIINKGKVGKDNVLGTNWKIDLEWIEIYGPAGPA